MFIFQRRVPASPRPPAGEPVTAAIALGPVAAIALVAHSASLREASCGRDQNTSKGFWRAFGLGARSTAGGGRPGTRTVPPQAHVSPPTRPEPRVQLVRSRFAGFSKIDPFHSLKVG